MPRRCTVCDHPDRKEIDEALVSGSDSLRDIARRVAVSKDALARHKADHLPAKLAKAHEAREVTDADSLLTQMTALQADTLETLATLKAEKNHGTALKAIDVARRNIELLAELTGKLAHQPTVNVLVSVEWGRVRAALLEALGPYPEARAAVSARLVALEAGGNGG